MVTKSTLKLLWTLVLGFGVLLATVGKSEVIQVPDFSSLAQHKATILAALDAGKNVRLFNTYLIDRKQMRCDFELVLTQIAQLDADLKTFHQSVHQLTDNRSKQLKDQHRALRLAADERRNKRIDDLYSLVVEQSNLRLNEKEKVEDFNRQNRVVMKVGASDQGPVVKDLYVIRDGKRLRSRMSTITARLPITPRSPEVLGATALVENGTAVP